MMINLNPLYVILPAGLTGLVLLGIARVYLKQKTARQPAPVVVPAREEE